MNDFSSFLPKFSVLAVGAVELDAQEFTIAKRDAVLKIILSGLDVATILRPFWDAAKAGSKTEIDLSELVVQLKGVVTQILTNDLTTVSCLTLDTPSNRKKLAVFLENPNLEKTAEDPKHGYIYSPQMFLWLKENLTARQECHLLEMVVEINDFVGLIKNYVALVAKVTKLARES